MNRQLLWILSLVVLVTGPTTGAAEVSGRVVAPRAVELGLVASGVIESVAVRAGDRVEAGDRLLRLEARVLKARIVAADAGVTAARLAWDEARKERDRAQELFDRTVLSDHDLQLAKISYSEVNRGYREALAKQADARQALSYAELKAPFAGRVVLVNAVVGQAVVNRQQITPLVRLQPVGRRRVIAEVPGGLEMPAPGSVVAVQSGRHQWSGIATDRIGAIHADTGNTELEIDLDTSADAIPEIGAEVRIAW